jgi:hypothetical protein
MKNEPRWIAAIALALVCAASAAVFLARKLPDRAGALMTAPPPTPIEPAEVGNRSGPRGACELSALGPDGLTGIERAVRAAVQGARFDEVIDFGPDADEACPVGPGCRPAPIAHPPNVDVAVIAFPPNCPPAFANAMLSRDFPGVRVNKIDAATLAVRGVRYRRWDQARWDGGVFHPDGGKTEARGWTTDPVLTADDDVVPGEPEAGAVDFFIPYPASNFKLLVAVQVLKLAERGAVRLDDKYAHEGRERELRAWMEDMITWSDNDSTQALVRRLHELGEADTISALFERIGLTTLKMSDTSPKTGRNWQPGRFHMSAWDTARLLWLLDDAAPPPPSWARAPSGAPAEAGFLGAESRRVLLGLLRDQALHDALSTTGLCGLSDVQLQIKIQNGIPALFPERWLGEDGRIRVEGIASKADVRPCNAEAEVTFAHKTGLTQNFGSDAGIVRGIPGRARRHYIIAFFSNLGYRYTDPERARGSVSCKEHGICYTQRVARMASAIDAALKAAIEWPTESPGGLSGDPR